MIIDVSRLPFLEIKDLLIASGAEDQIRLLLGPVNYQKTIYVRELHGSYSNGIKIENDYAQELFEKLLPIYITRVTDEILGQIDQMQYLLENKDLQQQDY